MNDATATLIGETIGQITLALAPPSLRDQFAMAALTGLIASNPTVQASRITAIDAYVHADAMMKAREQDSE